MKKLIIISAFLIVICIGFIIYTGCIDKVKEIKGYGYLPLPTGFFLEEYNIDFLERERELVNKIEKTILFRKNIKIEVDVGGQKQEFERYEIIDPIHDLKFYFDVNEQKIDYVDKGNGIESVNKHQMCWWFGVRPYPDYKYNSIKDEQMIIGFNEEKIYMCQSQISNLIGDPKDEIGKITTFIIYGNVTSDNRPDSFFAIAIMKEGRYIIRESIGYFPTDIIIVLKDDNGDGMMESFKHQLIVNIGRSYTNKWGQWIAEGASIFFEEK